MLHTTDSEKTVDDASTRVLNSGPVSPSLILDFESSALSFTNQGGYQNVCGEHLDFPPPTAAGLKSVTFSIGFKKFSPNTANGDFEYVIEKEILRRKVYKVICYKFFPH